MFYSFFILSMVHINPYEHPPKLLYEYSNRYPIQHMAVSSCSHCLASQSSFQGESDCMGGTGIVQVWLCWIYENNCKFILNRELILNHFPRSYFSNMSETIFSKHPFPLSYAFFLMLLLQYTPMANSIWSAAKVRS